MTAYKPRKPGSFDGAMTEIRNLFGAGPMGLRVGVSDATINAACDRDVSNYTPQRIDRCLDLDVWFTQATGRRGPVLQAYETQYDLRTREMPVAGAPHENMANASKEVADVLEAISRFVLAEQEEGDHPSRRASAEVVRQVDDVINLMQAIRTKHLRNAGLMPSDAPDADESGVA